MIKYVGVVLVFFGTVIFYQNCGRGFSVDGSDNSSNSGLGTTTPGATDPGFFLFPYNYTSEKTSYVLGVPVLQRPKFSSVDVFPFSFSVDPALPNGLYLDKTTGNITGTPQKETADGVYTVTALTNKGTAKATLKFAVAEGIPSLDFQLDSVQFYLGIANRSLSPKIIGTRNAKVSVSPLLPAGMGIDPLTGTISGNPGALSGEQTYIVKIENAVGSSEVPLKLAVVDAPVGSSYTYAKNTYTVGAPIRANPPIVPAFQVLKDATISPRLPTGLTISTIYGTIEGTPVAISNETNYIATLTFSSGAVYSVAVNMKVQNAAPRIDLPGTEVVTAALGSNFDWMAQSLGGIAQTYEISPATLPEGLTFNSTIGRISGTPKKLTEAVDYTVIGKNEIGQSTVGFKLKVGPALPNPNYPFTTVAMSIGSAIDPLLPNVPASGGEVNWFAAESLLPDGLSLDNRTGKISGAPTSELVNKSVRIVASGSGGYKVITWNFTSRPKLPLVKSVIASTCLGSDASLCWLNTDIGTIALNSVQSAATLAPIEINGQDGDIASEVRDSSRFLLSTEGTLFVSDVYGTKFSIVPGYQKNVKKIFKCDYTYLCVLLKSGTAQVLRAQNVGAEPTSVTIVPGYEDLPTNAEDMNLSQMTTVCFIVTGGGLKCRTNVSSFPTTPTPTYDTGITNAVRIQNVLGTFCAILADNSAVCFNSSLRPISTSAMIFAGLGANKIVSGGYGFACALTPAAGVKCWGRNKIVPSGTNPPAECSVAPCPPLFTTAGDVPGLTSGVVDIAIGDLKMCALLDTGVVRCTFFDPAAPAETRYQAPSSELAGMKFGIKSLKTAAGGCMLGLTDTGSLKTACWPGTSITDFDKNGGSYLAR